MSEEKVKVELTAKEMKKLKKMSRPFWKKKRFLFPAILIVIIIAVASHGSGSSTQTATTSSTSSSKTASNSSSASSSSSSNSSSTVYKVGQTFKVGEFQYTVNSVKTANSIGDVANGLGEKAHGIYYIVNITATNLDKTASTVDSNLFNIVQGGNKYSADSMATTDDNDTNNDMFLTQLNPNVSMTGNLVFDVPANLTSGLQLQLSGGFTSGETATVQLN
jgi:uncharacterized protein (UPF0333 family)